MSWEPPYDEAWDQEDEACDFKVKILNDNPNKGAILISDDDIKEVWIPRQFVTYIDYDENNFGYANVGIIEWMAIEKGLL